MQNLKSLRHRWVFITLSISSSLDFWARWFPDLNRDCKLHRVHYTSGEKRAARIWSADPIAQKWAAILDALGFPSSLTEVHRDIVNLLSVEISLWTRRSEVDIKIWCSCLQITMPLTTWSRLSCLFSIIWYFLDWLLVLICCLRIRLFSR